MNTLYNPNGYNINNLIRLSEDKLMYNYPAKIGLVTVYEVLNWYLLDVINKSLGHNKDALIIQQHHLNWHVQNKAEFRIGKLTELHGMRLYSCRYYALKDTK